MEQWPILLLATAIVFAAGLMSSIAGFAFSALAGAPLLWLLRDPVTAVGIIVIASIAIQGYCVWALRLHVEWRLLWPFVAGGVLTVPYGVWLLALAPVPQFAAGLGAFLVLYGVYMLCRGEPPVLRGNRWTDAAFGALGGITGGLAGFPGAFVTLWCGMRGWTKERQRAVYQPYILLMQMEALACLGTQAPQVVAPALGALYGLAGLAAACLGFALFRRLDGQQFNFAVQLLLLFSGIALLGSNLQLG